ncbi:flavodoxin [Butyrivibrio sp. CB08]|uniref:flavodoxin domain-containing protein n=1 Tax=Butyrivibrio sp. CB08 TaxID=2364879 RepID=UPI000EA9F402|nr:flavodoxin domain-containing protein [Butyrivibrio sp. CB08]RKM59419.1 flavodoxin [Butyrivibrio sp. CB08]
MKTLVVYTSQTGFTKRYAQWIAERMSADILDLKDAQKKDDSSFAGYEAIVYAGWLMAGKVVKVNWFFEKAKGWKDKHLALVAVGGSPNDNPDVETALKDMLTEEQSAYIKAFYCQGGFNYEKMNLPSKLAMKAFVSTLKKSKDEKQREVGSYIDHSYDVSDIKFIEPVVAYLQGNVVA